MITSVFFLGFASLASTLVFGGPVTNGCNPNNRTISLNSNSEKFGYSHDGRAIPNGYQGLDWYGFYDAPGANNPPSGQYSIGMIDPPFAYFYVNTTTYPSIQSVTLHSFAFVCEHSELVGQNTTSPVVGQCKVTVTAVGNSDNYGISESNMIRSEVFESSYSGFETVAPKEGFLGTHFFFFITTGFPSSVVYLDNIVVQNNC